MRRLPCFLLLTMLGCLGIAVADAADKGMIDQNLIESFDKALSQQPGLERIVNAATNNDIKALSLNRELVKGHDSRFNFEVEGTKIINQKSSGRCWMFAGANVVTPKVMTRLKLSDFKLSEAYLAFWDKLEKSNLFLEIMIEMRDRDLDDRSLQTYLDDPIGDGGWWQYFTALIGKYGVVPMSAMPETKQSSSTGRLNGLLKTLLRKATAELRSMHESGKKEKDLREYKEEVLADVYKLLVCTYGRTPKEFVFRYEEESEDEESNAEESEVKAETEAEDEDEDSDEKKTKLLVDHDYTPLSFYHEFYGEQMPEYVALVDNPAMEYSLLYELIGGRNVFEETDLTVLNLPVEKLKDYAYRMILDSQIVWFACDVSKDNFNDSGMFAVDIYDYSATFGIDFGTTKADRINYNDMSPNHAMALLAVDTTENGVPRKWKVENSWGGDKGSGGYWTMYDSWFDEYVLLVIVDKELLGPEDAALFDQKPVIIEDWQPFFAALKNLQ